jgi:orotidine-5'-phosphate decarboxylase
MNSYNKLLNIQKKNKSILCVGLDTDINKLPTPLLRDSRGMLDFNKSIIEATKDLVSAYKINFAFYEQYGIEGFEVLKKTIDYIPHEILIIADAKRADIGNTSLAYARSCFDYFKADAITVNPYMGFDSVEPFLQYKDKMVFLLALTSNPGSNDFQRLISDGKPLYRYVFEKSLGWSNHENLGYVVGATHPEELAQLRELAPNNVFLIPGVGAQGGDVPEVLKANRNCPAIINVSRGIIYASKDNDFAEKAREKAIFYRDLTFVK